MNTLGTFLSAVLVLGFVTTASAATLITGAICPLCGLAPSPFIGCSVTNASNKALDVTVEIINATGVAATTTQTVNVPPFGTKVVIGDPTVSGYEASPFSCRFQFEGRRKKVRAHACKADFSFPSTTEPSFTTGGEPGCINAMSKAE